MRKQTAQNLGACQHERITGGLNVLLRKWGMHMVYLLPVGIVFGLLAKELDRQIEGTLYGKALISEANHKVALELLRLLGVLAGTACFLAGFFLLIWWQNFLLLLGCIIATVPIVVPLRRPVERAFSVMPFAHGITIVCASILWWHVLTS